MELLQESSNTTALSTSRNLSSSSSAFVSAIQSPFFSPRSPQASKPEQNLLDIAGSSTGSVISRETLASVSGFKQSELISNLKNFASEVSPTPSFYTSSYFEVPTTTFRSSNIVSPNNGLCSSSNYSHDGNGRREKQKRYGSSHGKHSFSWSPATISSAGRLRNCDVYIGFHGRKPSLLRFANWLRAEFELHGISCFASDRAHCRNSRSRDTVEKIMHASSFGVVIITKKCFGNSYSIEELKYFLDKKSLCPIFFDLSSCDCLARDIVEKRGELWEKYGGELWMLYGGLEKEWIEAVDGLSRTLEWQLEAYDGNWRACILQAVVLLATRLGRRSVLDRVNKWREKVEKEEFPFPRNEDFVGRNKELSELELILFGDVSGDGEREYFELKTRHRRKSVLVGRTINFREDKNSICQHSESSGKGKEPVLWKESEKAIEMQRLSSPAAKFRPRRAKFGTRKRSMKIVYSKRIACVSGDSGIGKTELALEYAYRFSQRYKVVLWLGGESRYIRQNYLNLHSFLEVDLSIESVHLDKGKLKCFEKQEDEAITRIRKELMRDIPFLVVIDNLESEDWWDRKVLMDFLPRFGGETHFIITTRLPQVINLEPLKLSYLSGGEALCLMKGGVKDYPVSEIDALRVLEEKLGRLTLGLGIVGAILSEIPITPTRLLDTINRMMSRDTGWNDRDSVSLRRHAFLVGLLDVCLSIFDHADGPRSLATRMVQISSFFAPSAVPVSLLALAAHKALEKHSGSLFWKKNLLDKFTRSRLKRTEAEASSMLVRFAVARCSTRPDCIYFHEIVKLYARKRGVDGVMLAMVRAVSLRGSIFHSSEHLWAACFLLFGFGTDRVFVELKPTELIQFIKRVALPLAVHTFIAFSRCVAAMELLRLCTEALEVAAESLVSRSEKWFDKSFCCLNLIRSDARYMHLWQELALSKATVLETRAKFMLKGGKYDMGDDLIRKAIFIRTSINGEHHPDTISARETLSKLTRLLATDQVLLLLLLHVRFSYSFS
ncbi:uncharacterized protein LOC110023421 [Phalaenopsis equestris]|uniref:uncharacterized protein LOC110023421 n=1 Tax=Phalaenopsis equestris TaxID=78828 RepID=UPI0009E4ECE7|nr:uncharacterized protein LOC110023421 [Phalaenopsis equestris]